MDYYTKRLCFWWWVGFRIWLFYFFVFRPYFSIVNLSYNVDIF